MDFNNLKQSYIATIQLGMSCNVDYEETKRGNDLLHRFCERVVDSSNHLDGEKKEMKQELSIIKETLSQEIDLFYRKG